MKKAVVLLSGGMDSATCVHIARAEGYAVHALSFAYGQRMPRELEAARAVARAAGVAEHVEMAFGLASWGGSAITDAALPLPIDPNPPDRPAEMPLTYVPARNLVFLSGAYSFAEAIGAEAVYTGLIAGWPHYPDARPEFLVAFEAAARLGTQAGVSGRAIALETPLLFSTKAAIVQQGLALGVDFGLTWSCYEGGVRPCGVCDACRLRAEGFAGAGVPDPLLAGG